MPNNVRDNGNGIQKRLCGSSKKEPKGETPTDTKEEASEEYPRTIEEARFAAFCGDSDNALKIRNERLGLDPWTGATCRHVADSGLYDCVENKDGLVEDISHLWEKLLTKEGRLETRHPHSVEPEDNWEAMYLTTILFDLVEHSIGAWKASDKKPHFVIVAHRSRTSAQLKTVEFGFTIFHIDKAVKHITLYLPTKGIKDSKTQKQYAICPYCGVYYANVVTALSHLSTCVGVVYLPPSSPSLLYTHIKSAVGLLMVLSLPPRGHAPRQSSCNRLVQLQPETLLRAGCFGLR